MKTFKEVFEETREPAVVASWERALRANAFAKSAPTWEGRRAFYRAKAAAMSVAIEALPENLRVGDLPGETGPIAGIIMKKLPALHVALDLLTPEARKVVEGRIRWQERRAIARAKGQARTAVRQA